MQAQVRAIAYLHLARFGVDVPAEVREDPNRLLPASAFADALRQLAARDGPQAMERVAESMVASWRRTFPTLARYLRGRPDRCLNLWAEEVYPFLRGDRLAARVERLEPGRVRVLLHDDLPGAFLATLVARFTEVSGATAHATAAQGVLDVRYAVPPQDRLVSLLWLLGTLRVPLLLAAAVGAATGIAAAAALGMVDAVRALLLVAGVVSAQAGASALQELRRPPAVGPLGPPRPPRAFWVFQAAGGYTVGAGVAAWLALEAPAVLVPTFLGLVVGLAYPRVNDVGWGPALAGVTYGPLVVTGSVLALQPDVAWPATRAGEGRQGRRQAMRRRRRGALPVAGGRRDRTAARAPGGRRSAAGAARAAPP
ncbi:MAG TPA: hypothetical protein VFH47_08995 [Candidatus Thermoplasmatota archaeon]|nr:hypothetical protein [Candidatus Thermoplasmatota archaeon]